VSPNEVEAATNDVHVWAQLWLLTEPAKEAGHLMLRDLVMRTAFSPSDANPNADLSWNGSIMYAPFSEIEYDEAKGLRLIQKANAGDVDAEAALCGIAMYFILAQRPLPSPLGEYIATILLHRLNARGPRGRGGDRYANVGRNLFVVRAVLQLVRRGFRATRNRASRDGAQESACSIVAKALGRVGIQIDETGVEKIWTTRLKQFGPDPR
jgi:hypothetical protein